MNKIISLITVALLLWQFSLATQVQAVDETIIFQDNFNDGNYNGWKVESGDWFVDTAFQLTGFKFTKGYSGRISHPIEAENYTLELDLKSDAGVDSGVGFKRQDGANNYELQFRHGIGEYNTPEIDLNKVENGVFKNLFKTHSIPLSKSISYHIKLVLEGENIKLLLNGSQIFDLNDSGTTLKTGSISLSYSTGDQGTSIKRFDNVVVSSIPKPIPTPIPTPLPTPTPAKKTPLIFIPGIGGSEIQSTITGEWNASNGHDNNNFKHTYQAGEVLWLNIFQTVIPGDDDYFDSLRMNPDGETSQWPTDINGKILGISYSGTVSFFTSNGYIENKDFFVFPYDFRKDIALTADKLDSKINEIKQISGSDKVDIVTHSMGGLVARNYIADNTHASKVRKLIELGPPHLGSVEMLRKIMYGGCLTLPLIKDLPACLGVSKTAVKDILQNMLGAYQLNPSKKYYDFYDNSVKTLPIPINDNGDIDKDGYFGSLDYYQTSAFLKNMGYNSSLFDKAANFHKIDESYNSTNGVDVSIIAGSGFGTLGQIVEKFKFDSKGNKINSADIININGDDTVPLFSSSLNDQSRNLSLFDFNKVYYIKEMHENLPTNNLALKFTLNLLGDNNSLIQGINKTPFKFSGTQFSVHSPVNIHVYDQNGNHTGPTTSGDFETNIPGSSYSTLADAKFIFVPEEGTYSVKFDALDQGEFDFKVRHYQADLLERTFLYKDVPLLPQTKGEISVDTLSTTPSTINLDKDGDGGKDLDISATSVLIGDDSLDFTSPKTEFNITGQKGQNDWYTSDVSISLNGQDDEAGSGILRIEYSLDNGITTQNYSKPIAIQKEGETKISFKSIDKAGNEEKPQYITLKLDKTSPELNVQFNPKFKDFEFVGKDNLSLVNIENLSNQFKLTDAAGNTTTVGLTKDTKENQAILSLLNISYLNNPPVNFPVNEFEVQYKQEGNQKIADIDQKIIINNFDKLKAKFNLSRDVTNIEEKSGEEKLKTEKTGIVYLILSTKEGQLMPSY